MVPTRSRKPRYTRKSGRSPGADRRAAPKGARAESGVPRPTEEESPPVRQQRTEQARGLAPDAGFVGARRKSAQRKRDSQEATIPYRWRRYTTGGAPRVANAGRWPSRSLFRDARNPRQPPKPARDPEELINPACVRLVNMGAGPGEAHRTGARAPSMRPPPGRRVGPLAVGAHAKYPTRGANGPGNGVPGDAILRRPGHAQRRRHQLHESVIQRTVREAVLKTGLAKKATCHTFRHTRLRRTFWKTVTTSAPFRPARVLRPLADSRGDR